MGATDITAVPRRYEALAYIIERIVRTGTSPAFDEIGIKLGVGKTRASQLVSQLIEEGLVERPVGRQRSLRVRDVTHSRNVVVDVLNRLGWADAVPLGGLVQPCTQEQLTLIAELDHIPDVELPGGLRR